MGNGYSVRGITAFIVEMNPLLRGTSNSSLQQTASHSPFTDNLFFYNCTNIVHLPYNYSDRNGKYIMQKSA